MATLTWPTTSLLKQLQEKPYNFNFFQAVRLIDGIYFSLSDLKHSLPVGYHHPLLKENIHFSTSLALKFPATEIEKVLKNSSNSIDHYNLQVNFIGLFGQTGPLPEHYTELMIEQAKHKNYGLINFLNLFNHRLIALFYRAWERNNVYFTYQRHLKNTFSPTIETNKHTNFDKQQLLFYYAGLFSQQPRNAFNLEAILSDYLQLPISVYAFQGQWQTLQTCELSQLSTRPRHNALNRTLFLGKKFYSYQYKVQISVGPLDYDLFQALLPTGKQLKIIAELAKLYLNDTLFFEIKLILKAAAVPGCTLRYKPQSKLAWNTWLSTKPPAYDKQDVIFNKGHFKKIFHTEDRS